MMNGDIAQLKAELAADAESEAAGFKNYVFNIEDPEKHTCLGNFPPVAIPDIPCPRCGVMQMVRGHCGSTDSGQLVRCRSCHWQSETEDLKDLEIRRLRIRILELESERRAGL